MSRCTCVGPNPDCVHCGGSGEIPQNRAAALIGYACRPESEKIHPELRPPKLEGMVSKPKSVVRRARPPTKPSQSRAHPFRTRTDLPPGWTVCRRCGTRLKSKNLKSHAKKNCPCRESLVEYIPPTRTPLRGAPQTGTAKRTKSASKAHAPRGGSRATDVRARAAARSAVHGSIRSDISDAKAYSDETTKNQDATYAYGIHYRENGPFGSHPSHDGFDDESGPN